MFNNENINRCFIIHVSFVLWTLFSCSFHGKNRYLAFLRLFVIASALVTAVTAILKIILIIKSSKGAPPKNQTELGRFFNNTAKVSALIGSMMLVSISAYLCSAIVFDLVVFPSWVYEILHFVNSLLIPGFIAIAALYVFALFTLAVSSILNRNVRYNK